LILFASDIHLSPAVPRIVDRFTAFLAGTVRQAEALYLLGDVFEYWAGDDDLGDPFNAAMVASLRAAADSGTALFFIAGNRDFLAGERFAAAAGLTRLADPYVLTVDSWQLVLSHGDALCTRDTAYMAFREQVRDAGWQRRFLAQPLAVRKQQIAAIRTESERGKAAMRGDEHGLMDVDPATVDDFLRAHGYATLIHGHTHRPATHDHLVDGIHCQRWVLADWHDDRGEAIAWDGEALARLAV
jgi:UDP-2,3-diacylglucosamine hydrolase